MAVITKTQWKSFLKENDLKDKQSVGKLLDEYHEAKGVKAKMKALAEARGALMEFRVSKEVVKKDEESGDVDKALNDMIKDADLRMKVLAKRKETLDDIQKLKLKEVLKNTKLYKKFEAFCKKEYCPENLEFIKNCYSMKPKEVWDTYIKENAREQVNLPDATRRKLEEDADKEEWGKLDFTEAHREIYALLQSDTLQRFLKEQVEEIQEIVDSED